MAEFAAEFAHGGEHLDNDERQAKLVLFLLALFAPFAVWLLVTSVRAM